jgi:hypothetical protein
MFQPRYRSYHFKLDIFRKGTGKPIDIEFPGLISFRFKKKLMAQFIRKTDHLILNGWTIPWAHSLDDSPVERGPVQVSFNNFMGVDSGISNPAGDLLLHDLFRGIGEWHRLFVRMLYFAL